MQNSNFVMQYLYISLMLLAFVFVLIVVYFNLNSKMTEGQFGLITALKFFFSLNAFIAFVIELEILIHADYYSKLDTIADVVSAAITKLFL